MLIPVKKKIYEALLYGMLEEMEQNTISIKKIENRNHVLWSENINMNKLTPADDPYFKIIEKGEIEYFLHV